MGGRGAAGGARARVGARGGGGARRCVTHLRERLCERCHELVRRGPHGLFPLVLLLLHGGPPRPPCLCGPLGCRRGCGLRGGPLCLLLARLRLCGGRGPLCARRPGRRLRHARLRRGAAAAGGHGCSLSLSLSRRRGAAVARGRAGGRANARAAVRKQGKGIRAQKRTAASLCGPLYARAPLPASASAGGRAARVGGRQGEERRRCCATSVPYVRTYVRGGGGGRQPVRLQPAGARSGWRGRRWARVGCDRPHARTPARPQVGGTMDVASVAASAPEGAPFCGLRVVCATGASVLAAGAEATTTGASVRARAALTPPPKHPLRFARFHPATRARGQACVRAGAARAG